MHTTSKTGRDTLLPDKGTRPTRHYLTPRNIVISLLTGPITYSLVFPLALLDLSVTIYQAICFRIWNIEPSRRSDFVKIDRHRLPYLNAFQKVNCVYCGYANGTIAYVRDVASRTERYWCPIKHLETPKGQHDRYRSFQDYNDAEAWNRWLEQFEA